MSRVLFTIALFPTAGRCTVLFRSRANTPLLLQVLGPEHPGLSPQWIASCDMSASQHPPSSRALTPLPHLLCPGRCAFQCRCTQHLVNSVAAASCNTHDTSAATARVTCDGLTALQAGLDSLNVAAAGQLFLQHATLHLVTFDQHHVQHTAPQSCAQSCRVTLFRACRTAQERYSCMR